ncbi:MAG TPA: DUF5060 domain-containing protein [Planctomycetota bacterium]
MPRLLALLLLTGCSGAPLLGGSSVFTPSAREVEVYDVFEVEARPPVAAKGNPFVDATFRGRFQRAGEPAVDVDGFYDGDVFRIRFMPSRFGEHVYALTLNAFNRTFETKGTFKAKEARRRGPVRVDKVYPWHFVWEGTGERFLWNSTTAYGLLGWDDATMKEAVDRLAALKVNRIRVGLTWRMKNPLPSPRFTMTFGPWRADRPLDVENPGYDVKRFDLDLWSKAERLARHAREKDVALSFIFYVDGARKGTDPFGTAGMGGEDEKRYYRYAAARLGAFSNVMWDLANEYRLFRNDLWAEAMGTFLKEVDPYDHLTSVHGHADFKFHGSIWADYAAYQSWDEEGGHGFMLQARRAQAAGGRIMPQVNEEYGFEDHYPAGGRRAPARDAESRRRIAWGIAMAGGHQTTGERTTGAKKDSGGGWINGRGDASMAMLVGYARLSAFLSGVEAWRLEPRDELARNEAYCLAEPGRRYVLYQPEGRPATLQLEPGRYKVRRFDPRTGAWTDLPAVEGSRFSAPEAPSPDDWALVLDRS